MDNETTGEVAAKELMRFPVGKHDDQVDVLSLIGRMLSDMGTASDWSKPVPYMDVAVV